MTSTPFDTHEAFRELTQAGFGEAQAEAVIATIGNALGGYLATRQDIADIRSEMATKQDIADVRSEMATKQDIADIRNEMATKEDIRYMATKQDIADVRSEMATKVEVEALRREMATKSDLHALEVRLMVRLGGFIIAGAGLTVALVRFLA